ncbi:methyl coenzyme M reductase-arginine methyltransferase Mmp10 [Methanobacterium petrolearium]|uniref:methyl coenzyme M reductase-arginine methyltransferase Mmp10 n=1 Tax=Methanobacterium petrolearium TaxID=710190 RepID=UPI001AE8CC13|nr:methyl coenzyme M reductase-arginine methyltransferase Mmp10 [Methanobacterium petrolearium]MBP1945788.1 methanogenesis marker radical SAM protein [Methanobacterium petrolearium]BDZ69669.1 methanogenesis-associated radical SAM protein [Methanobacterium petrolearium]
MQIIADVGGIPGKDCRGFCKYCYFRKVKDGDPLGCKSCLPGTFGCEQCTTGVRESKNEFIPPFMVINSVKTSMMMGNYGEDDFKINISGGGDVSCYPYLLDITSAFSQWNIPIHLGYTSGKGIDNPQMANDLISHGVEEVTFTVFSTNPELRKTWMGDKNPQASLDALKIFSENCEVHAAAVILPGVNDGEDLRKTCADLEEWGAKAFIMMRFANFRNQGLILGNEPLIEGVTPHSLQEFDELVRSINQEFNLRVTGTPLCDPENNTPFALAKDNDKEYLDILSDVTSEATIISGNVAGPFIEHIFDIMGASDLVNVVVVDQDISCLITQKDLEDIDLNELKETVILPGRAFVHDKKAEEILCRDGVDRIVARGPDKLSVDGEMSGTLSQEDVLKTELIAFQDLIEAINFFGVRKK